MMFPAAFQDQTTETCANCGGTVATAYCGHCGQKRSSTPLALRTIAWEYFQDAFRLERGLLLTLMTLVTRPGVLTVDYLSGRRIRYSTPLRLYMLSSVLAFAFYVLTRPLDRSFYGFAASTDWNFVANVLAYGFLLSVPLVALALKLLYWRTGRPLVAHLIFTLHLGAAALISGAAFLLLDTGAKLLWTTDAQAPFDPVRLFIAVPLLLAAYLYQSLQVVYGGRWTTTLARAAVLLLLLSVVVVAVAIGAAGIAERRG